MLKGVSPVRSALIATSSLPEQNLDSFSFLSDGEDYDPRGNPLAGFPAQEGFPVDQMRERLLAKIMSVLTSVSVDGLELYREAFGFIIVVPVKDNESIALALGKEWPHLLLQANWIDREKGSTEEVQMDVGAVSALDLTELKKIISTAKESQQGRKK